MFDELGDALREEWRRFDFDNRAFPDIACRALSAARLNERVVYDDIVRWVAHGAVLPPQGDLTSRFGEPPIVLFWDPRFYIEALFWTTGTTAIHEHGFSGAFTVLAGSSLQCCYQFTLKDRVNQHMLLGDLELHDCRLLTRGDIEPIHPGEALIHSVFHLDTPSVTIVVRTHRDEDSRIQFQYCRPHLAIDPFFRDPAATRRLQIVDLLDRLESAQYEETTHGILERADCLETFELLRSCRLHRGGRNECFEQMTRIARGRHGERIDRLLPVLDEADREALLISRREKVADPGHRFFLALLLNLPDRDSILSMIRTTYPQEDPVTLVLSSLSGLSGTEMLGIEMDALNHSILRSLISGLSFDGVCDRLCEEYSRDDVLSQQVDLETHCDRITRLPALRTLLKARTPAFQEPEPVAPDADIAARISARLRGRSQSGCT